MLNRVLPVVFALLTIGSAWTPLSADDVADGTAASDDADSLDLIESEFREFICTKAADFSDAAQESAISIALRQHYVDERFNDLIRAEMSNASKPDHWDIDRLLRAEELLPLCTLDEQTRAELMFRCYRLCGQGNDDRQLERSLKNQLSRLPDETSRLLAKELGEDRYPLKLLTLVDIVGDSSEAVLPLLMKAAKSDDSKIANSAMLRIPDLLRELKKRRTAKAQAENGRKLGIDDIDDKLIVYARRIFSRYDGNGDDLLTADEYESMLMSPEASDRDSDGKISVLEYAAWMQQRSKR